MLSDHRALLLDTLSELALLAEAVHRIDHRTALIETELRRMLTAFSNGGIRGFRAAAKEGTSHG
jgi:hypothetical protein